MNDELERRYRQLLALYPWEHRRVYEDEMLGVLMAGARPGKRYPAFRDSLNLAACAVRMRVGRTVASFAEPQWVQAAAAVGLLAVIGMLGLRTQPILVTAGLSRLDTPIRPSYSLVELCRVAIWATVLLAALVGTRRLAAAGAWIAVVADVGLIALRYPVDPVPVVYAVWALVLAIVAAMVLSVSAPPRHGTFVLGWPRLAVGTLAAAIASGASAYNTIWWLASRTGTYEVFNLGGQPVIYEAGIAYLLAAVLAILVVLTLAPPVRRRLVALLAPVPVTLIILLFGYSGWADSSHRFATSDLLVPAQWTLLAATPLLTLLIGVALVGRREQVLRLLELGRNADRELPLGTGQPPQE